MGVVLTFYKDRLLPVSSFKWLISIYFISQGNFLYLYWIITWLDYGEAIIVCLIAYACNYSVVEGWCIMFYYVFCHLRHSTLTVFVRCSFLFKTSGTLSLGLFGDTCSSKWYVGDFTALANVYWFINLSTAIAYTVSYLACSWGCHQSHTVFSSWPTFCITHAIQCNT